MTDIETILKQFRVPYVVAGEHHHARANWVQIDCPYCSSRGGFHLGINQTTGRAACWRCGRKNLYDILLKITKLPGKEVYDLVKSVQFNAPVQVKATGKLELPKGLGPMQEPHRKYLRGRNFNPEELEELWGLMGIGIAPSLQWRIWVPVYLESVLVSWTTRSIGDSGLRYRSASADQEAVPHKSVLYGEHHCRHAVIVCEGPADVWAVGPGSVALFGTGFSTSQINRLVEYPIRIVCFDSQSAAQKEANKLCSTLEMFPGETINVVLDSKDPGCATKKEIKQLRNLLK